LGNEIITGNGRDLAAGLLVFVVVGYADKIDGFLMIVVSGSMIMLYYE
jgi:hypothetical protein